MHAIAAYRRLLTLAPGFAESHYRLAQLLERAGSWEEAREHYFKARECDALPLRCPEDFRQIYRDAAARHPSIVLVDSAAVLGPISPHGILDDHLYHDPQHPTLLGYIAWPRPCSTSFTTGSSLGWPEGVPAPIIEPDECARHFQLDKGRWVKVCNFLAWFRGAMAYIRHDPTERLKREETYREAMRLIESGKPVEQAGSPAWECIPPSRPRSGILVRNVRTRSRGCVQDVVGGRFGSKGWSQGDDSRAVGADRRVPRRGWPGLRGQPQRWHCCVWPGRFSPVPRCSRAVFPRAVRRAWCWSRQVGPIGYALMLVSLVLGSARSGRRPCPFPGHMLRRPLDGKVAAHGSVPLDRSGWLGSRGGGLDGLVASRSRAAAAPARLGWRSLADSCHWRVERRGSSPISPGFPWGQILGWQLETILPGRPVQVDMQAEGGATLEKVHQKLARLSYHPDAMLLFCGHNEFQARWAWDRSPPYYRRRSRPETWPLELALRMSPSCRLVHETLDRRQVGAIPLDRVSRPLVDRPTFTRKERAELLADFRRRVLAITAYCESMGTVPVFIVPASNDGDYEPSRSALPRWHQCRPTASRSPANSAACGHWKQTEPSRAMAGYRALLERAPGFAETHYRLARSAGTVRLLG